ncbi:unnamed protein product [Peronospora destructor]|uniref:Uncharacterized protein n=1 Tax=Peronospora destructor TaxID=86335 RepID=A0AAV0TWK7_9STRA|nr:unnamed protein product [Peronospora destructor]
MRNDTVEESTAHENDDQATEATAFDPHASISKTANDEPIDPGSLSSPRASTRIGKRTSIASDGTASAASSRNSRNRIISVFAASASEKVSGSESRDASALKQTRSHVNKARRPSLQQNVHRHAEFDPHCQQHGSAHVNKNELLLRPPHIVLEW